MNLHVKSSFFSLVHTLYKKETRLTSTEINAIRDETRRATPDAELPVLAKIHGTIARLSRDVDMLITGQHTDDPEIHALRSKYPEIWDTISGLSDDNEISLRMANFKIRDCFDDPIVTLYQQAREAIRTRRAVQENIQPLIEPARIGRGYQERARRIKGKHDHDTYVNKFFEVRALYPSWNKNTVLLHVAKLLSTTPRNIQRHISQEIQKNC